MFDDSRKKFQLGLVYIFALLAFIGIGPMIVLRYVQGEHLHALLNLAIVAMALLNAAYARWRGEATPLPRHLAAVFYTLSAIVVIYLNSAVFVLWIFPCVLANFFLVPPNRAIVINLVAIGSIVPVAWRLTNHSDAITMMASLTIGSIMAYLFARLTEQQRQRLEVLAAQDPLTMLGNRRLMDEELRLCIEDFTRYKTPATLIVFDLDFFKRINDQFGHSEGDKILMNISSLLTARLRKTDRAFRFGGEEFVVLARNAQLDEGGIIAEQIRSQIATAQQQPAHQQPAVSLSASFGCASLRENENQDQWFMRADSAMYRAKAEGRNRVVLDDGAADQTAIR